MRVLTQDALILCSHKTGKVSLVPSQTWVTIHHRAVLVKADPVGRPISGCPVPYPAKLCTSTLIVRQGYSSFVRIGGRQICLDTVTGSTDGTSFPAEYNVSQPGQVFVTEGGG